MYHQIGHGLTAIMAGHVLAGRLALGAGFFRMGEHVPHQGAQVGLRRIGPAVSFVVPELGFETAGFDQFVVEEVARLVRHELRIRAPVRCDDRPLHKHGLMLRASPALASARGHVAVAGQVQAWQLRAGHLLGDEFDPG